MRLAHHLHQHPLGVFYFRLIVPADLQPAVGRKVIKKSLHTRDPATAKVWAYILSAKHNTWFRDLRMKPPIDPMSVQFDEAKNYELELPNGTKVKADSVDDHLLAMEALEMLSKAGALKTEPKPASVSSVPPAAKLMLLDGITRWEGLIKKDTKPETLKSKLQAVKEFAKWKGNVPLDTLNSTHFADFHVFLINDRNNEKPTAFNKFTYIIQFMDQMQAGNFYPKGDNPARGHVSFSKREKRARKKKGFQAFTNEQLAKIFHPSTYLKLKKPHEFWVPLIQLFTGARVNEVCQLECANFTTFEGIPTVSITDEGENQSVKAEASIRHIPLHPDLVNLGLLDFVEEMRAAGHRMIFPYLYFTTAHKYGGRQTKAFTRYLQKLGITSPMGIIGTHSFRKTINQHIQDHVPIDVRSQYLGHEHDSENSVSYSKKYSPKALATLLLPHIKYNFNLLPLKYTRGNFKAEINRELIYLKIQKKNK